MPSVFCTQEQGAIHKIVQGARSSQIIILEQGAHKIVKRSMEQRKILKRSREQVKNPLAKIKSKKKKGV